MSFKRDAELIEKYKELQAVGSAKVTIPWDQVLQVVVADLAAKHKACSARQDEYAESFRKVLSFYLEGSELAELDEMP